MKKYKIEEGAVTLEIDGERLLSATLTPGFTRPDVIHIPSEIDGNGISSIGRSGEQACSFLSNTLFDTSIIIDDQISFIDSGAFMDVKLNELHWPAFCTNIPVSCFYDAEIRKITGIEDVWKINKNAFSFFRGIKDFVIPESCRSIKEDAFLQAEFETISGGKNVTQIDPSVFYGAKIKKIDWFPNINRIPENTFAYCEHLEEITNIQKVVSIGAYAFLDTRFETFTWPDNCPSVPSSCFCDCTKLKEIRNLDSVEKICDFAFENCKSLKEVEFSSILQHIGCEAFLNSGLKRADLSETMVETIGKDAFEAGTEIIPSICCLN